MMGLFRKLFRLFNKENYVYGEGSVVEKGARVLNPQGDKQAIKLGMNSRVLGELMIFGHGGKINIGDECYISQGSRIWSAESIKIGDRVMIAHNVNIMDNQTHPISAVQRNRHFLHLITEGHPKDISLGEKAIVIEDDAWIACQSIILRGVHIGEGAIVGAGSVVVKDVPAWSIVAGNPAKVVRMISKDER